MNRALRVRFLVALAVVTTAQVAGAQTFNWNVNSGSFTSAANWTPAGGPPGVTIGTGAAFFGPSVLTNYLATFGTDWAVANLNVSQGTTTFALGGNTFSVNGTFFGSVNSETTTLNITHGTYLTPGGSTVDFAAGTNANFTLNLNQAVFAANNFTDMASGGGSTFNLNVRTGSTYSALNNSFIGIVGTANVLVDGVGSSTTLGSGSRVGSGNGSSGSVSVQNGATFNTTGTLSIGATTGATGTVTVAGSGSTWTHSDGTITAGGGTLGTINVLAGGTMNLAGNGATAGLVLNSNSNMTVSGAVNVGGLGQSGITLNGGNLTINAQGSVTTDYFNRNTGGSVLTVNGGMLTVNRQFNLGVAPLTLSGNSATANPTLQFQNGATASGITTLTLGNVAARRGTLNVLSGATATFSNAMTIGSVGTGTVLIDGAGSRVNSTQVGGTSLNIGSGGTGTVTVQNGGSYQSDPVGTNIVLGQSASGAGALTVTGAGSSFTTGGVSVGQAGSGALSVLAGGTFSAGRVQIGENVGGAGGTVTVSGPGSTLTSPSGLFIGGTAFGTGAANSQLIVANNGSVIATTTVGTQSIIYAGGSLTINGGGAVSTGNLTRIGTLTINNGTLTIDGGFFDAGNSAVPVAIQGNAAGALATLQILGSTTSNIGTLAVGATRPGAVIIGAGAVVSPNAVTFSTSSAGSGTINLSGANSALSVGTNLTFGPNGSSSLTIGTGSSANVSGTLSLGASGTINLNGGTLNLGTLALNGGLVNWNSGTVAFTGTATLGATELATLLGPGGSLSAGRTLKGSVISGNPLTLSGSLNVTGGIVTASDVVNSATLSISAGTVQAASSINNNAGSLVTVGNGAVLSAGTTFNSGEIQFGGGAARLVGALNNSGRIVGSGTITGVFSNNSGGRVIVDAGQRLSFGGSVNSNASNAAIELTGGTIEFTGQISNSSNGLISGRGVFRASTSNVSGVGLVNTGAVAFSGGLSDVFGKVNNNAGGQIVTAGGGLTTFHDDVVHNGVEIRTAPGARTVFLGAQSGAGPFTSTGAVEYQGDLRPGNSPAIVTYGGDFVLGNSANLQIEIGGPTPGFGANNHDQLLITGGAFLDGTVTAQLINGYTPTPGTVIEFMRYGTVTGNFAQFVGLNIGGGLSFLPVRNAGNYQFVVVPEPASVLGVGAAGLALGVWVRRRRKVEPAAG